MLYVGGRSVTDGTSLSSSLNQSSTVNSLSHKFNIKAFATPATKVNLLNNWKFVYFLCGLSPPKRHVVRQQNFAHRHVTTMCRTSVGFYLYRGRRYQKNDIFQKTNLSVGLQFCSGQSAG